MNKKTKYNDRIKKSIRDYDEFLVSQMIDNASPEADAQRYEGMEPFTMDGIDSVDVVNV